MKEFCFLPGKNSEFYFPPIYIVSFEFIELIVVIPFKSSSSPLHICYQHQKPPFPAGLIKLGLAPKYAMVTPCWALLRKTKCRHLGVNLVFWDKN